MDSGRHPPLVLLALLAVSCLLTVVAVLAGSAGWLGTRAAPAPAERAEGAEPAQRRSVAPVSGRGSSLAWSRPDVQAAALLHAWDVRRARAWCDGDVAGLRVLYVPGSRAGERDVSMLRAWLRRGLRVRALSTQLLEVHVRGRTPDRLAVVVTDRVSGLARAPGAEPVALPADLPTRRVVVLQRDAGRWLVAAVHS